MDEEYLLDLKSERENDHLLAFPSLTSLPILRYRLHILYLLEHNTVLLVAGETGSGKSTRTFQLEIPRFLYEAGWDRRIAVVLPRRISAVSLANHLAADLPRAVGYRIRFDNKTRDDTRIVYLTDGVLMREVQKDPLLSEYSVIIFDDAHERNKNIDVLMGVVKM
jgi:HrpA-like RNA helicase